jgi:hypothetical protein
MAAALSLHALAFSGGPIRTGMRRIGLEVPESGGAANPAWRARSFFQQAGMAEIATTTVDAGGKRGSPLRREHRLGADS